MSIDFVVVILLLLAITALDLAALRWGADSRRFDTQSYAPGLVLRPGRPAVGSRGNERRRGPGFRPTALTFYPTGIFVAAGLVSTGFGIWSSSTPSVRVAVICAGVTSNGSGRLR